jgi:endonuclease YncB( thermonuclease family)
MRCLALILALLLPAQFAEAQTVTGVASVIDGDTIEIRGQRIRLHGIDAPESRQLCLDVQGQRWRCGQQAAFALADEIGRAPVACRVRDYDRYDRAIAVCAQDGADLNEWMVREGWAVAYRRYSRDYIPAENRARQSRRNIWAGQFDMPWDWRRAQRGG